MDPYTPALLAAGLRGMIGKGTRSARRSARRWPGTARSTSRRPAARARCWRRRIKSAEVVAWEDLGPEAVRRLVVEDFPLVVIDDVLGHDLYEEGAARYRVG